MKKPTACLLALSAAGLLFTVALPATSHGQDGGADPVNKLVEEVVAQQTQIVANQTAMDEKIAAIAEAVRQARIFAGRGGGVHK